MDLFAVHLSAPDFSVLKRFAELQDVYVGFAGFGTRQAIVLGDPLTYGEVLQAFALEQLGATMEYEGRWELAAEYYHRAITAYGIANGGDAARVELRLLRVEMRFGRYDVVRQAIPRIRTTYRGQIHHETMLGLEIEGAVLDFHEGSYEAAYTRLEGDLGQFKQFEPSKMGDAHQIAGRAYALRGTQLKAAGNLQRALADEHFEDARDWHADLSPSAVAYDDMRDWEASVKASKWRRQPAPGLDDPRWERASHILSRRLGAFHLDISVATHLPSQDPAERIERATKALRECDRLRYPLGSIQCHRLIALGLREREGRVVGWEKQADHLVAGIAAYPYPDRVQGRNAVRDLRTLLEEVRCQRPHAAAEWLGQIESRVTGGEDPFLTVRTPDPTLTSTVLHDLVDGLRKRR